MKRPVDVSRAERAEPGGGASWAGSSGGFTRTGSADDRGSDGACEHARYGCCLGAETSLTLCILFGSVEFSVLVSVLTDFWRM